MFSGLRSLLGEGQMEYLHIEEALADTQRLVRGDVPMPKGVPHYRIERVPH